MTTKAELDAVKAAIVQTTHDIAELESKLKESDAHYAAAWATYGSELGPDTPSRELGAKIKSANDLLRVLSDCRDGSLDPSEENLQKLSGDATRLRQELQVCERKIADIRIVRALICTKQTA